MSEFHIHDDLDRPPYMLSDEELLLDDDQDNDPFADDVTEELDFERFEEREYTNDIDIYFAADDEDDDIIDDALSDIDNERW